MSKNNLDNIKEELNNLKQEVNSIIKGDSSYLELIKVNEDFNQRLLQNSSANFSLSNSSYSDKNAEITRKSNSLDDKHMGLLQKEIKINTDLENLEYEKLILDSKKRLLVNEISGVNHPAVIETINIIDERINKLNALNSDIASKISLLEISTQKNNNSKEALAIDSAKIDAKLSQLLDESKKLDSKLQEFESLRHQVLEKEKSIHEMNKLLSKKESAIKLEEGKEAKSKEDLDHYQKKVLHDLSHSIDEKNKELSLILKKIDQHNAGFEFKKAEAEIKIKNEANHLRDKLMSSLDKEIAEKKSQLDDIRKKISDSSIKSPAPVSIISNQDISPEKQLALDEKEADLLNKEMFLKEKEQSLDDLMVQISKEKEFFEINKNKFAQNQFLLKLNSQTQNLPANNMASNTSISASPVESKASVPKEDPLIQQEKQNLETLRKSIYLKKEALAKSAQELQETKKQIEAETTKKHQELKKLKFELDRRQDIISKKEAELSQRESMIHRNFQKLKEERSFLSSEKQTFQGKENSIKAKENMINDQMTFVNDLSEIIDADLKINEALIQLNEHLAKKNMPKARESFYKVLTLQKTAPDKIKRKYEKTISSFNGKF